MLLSVSRDISRRIASVYSANVGYFITAVSDQDSKCINSTSNIFVSCDVLLTGKIVFL